MKDDTALPDNPTTQRINELNFSQWVFENTAFLCLPRFPAIRRVDNHTLKCLFRRVALRISDRPAGVFVNEKDIVEARLPIRLPDDLPVTGLRFSIGSTSDEYTNQNTNQSTSQRGTGADILPLHYNKSRPLRLCTVALSTHLIEYHETNL